MLLEKLREYAEEQLDLPPAGYQKQTIRYINRLAPDGRFLNCEDTADSANKVRGIERVAPAIKRTVGVSPKLLADTGEYVLGIARDDPKKPAKPERVEAQRASFAQLVNECAAATSEPSVQAVAAFLTGNLPTKAELAPNFDASATMTFRVNDAAGPGDVLPISLASVQAFWAARQAPDAVTSEANAMPCIVCGTVWPVLERHPFKIKGIPGGQILKDLISANAPAFESYGLNASEIAPTCPTCAEAYGNALNALLANKSTSLWTKELAYAFWTDPGEEAFGQIVIGAVSDPQSVSGEVRELLTAYRSGNIASLSLNPARFYAAAFGASGARVVVKDWIDTTVGEAKARLARYFALQEMVQWDGSPSRPLPVTWIANAIVHRKATAPPIVSQSLVRLALAGEPLPLDLLFLAVRRNRAEQGVSRERAMLIKMVEGSRRQHSLEEVSRMTTLDSTNDRPAYVCGRLLATLDRIQRVALGTTNATIVDKFYGTASSAPASVFGTLLHGAQNHLGKMRRDRPGAHYVLEQQLEQILAPMTAFPMTLTLQDQGLFALGFYHQRAADRAQAAANKAKREAEGKPVAASAAGPDDIVE
ncbi:type I-C CRISPR-associated protein Cas8c/Csd1 [soil metagenome]